MKKIFFTLFLLSSISLFSQQRTGISYQALILNPNGEQLPGYNNQNAPLVNTDICIEFLILDENSSIEYSETQSVKTDKYGMVNLSIGNGSFAGGYSGGWSGIVWSEKSKKLKVNLDTTGACSSFTEISNQDLTAVPFALFAPGQEGLDGETAYEIWLSEGNVGSVQDYLDSLKGEKGDDGLSAFQIWKDLGNSETEEDFITALKGEDGADGKSAYQIWIDAGNTGTEAEFLSSLIGVGGTNSTNTLIKTTSESIGTNCLNGGVKLEYGLDSNNDGTLDDEEIDSSFTKYICNGLVNDGSLKGNTTFWDGEKWILDNNQLFNDGSNIMIGTSTVDENSVFTIESNEKGILIPRLTKEQRDAISSPTTSLLIYQSDNTPGFYYYNGSLWKYLTNITPGSSSSSTDSSNNTTLIYLNSF
ncbi:hypothetical protein OAT29_02505 [Flavobacteriaceae bacterium]|nr:hypothetical protein [Flavobacteriaceae bacterium]